MSTIHLKIYFENSTIQLEAPSAFKDLMSFYLIPATASAFTYLDHEGDTIEISNEDDYQMALAYAVDHKISCVVLDVISKDNIKRQQDLIAESQVLESEPEPEPKLEIEQPISDKIVNKANQIYEIVKEKSYELEGKIKTTADFISEHNQIFLPKAKEILNGFKDTCKINYDEAVKAINNAEIDKKVLDMVDKVKVKVARLKPENKKAGEIPLKKEEIKEKKKESKSKTSKKEKKIENVQDIAQKLNDVTKKCIKKVQGLFSDHNTSHSDQIKRIKAKAKNNIQRLVNQEFKILYKKICYESTKNCYKAIEEAAALKLLELNNQKPQSIVKFEVKEKVTCGNCIRELNSQVYYQSSKNEELTICEACEEELACVESFGPFIKIRPQPKAQKLELIKEESEVVESKDTQEAQLNELIAKVDVKLIEKPEEDKISVDQLSQDEFACFLVLMNNTKAEYSLNTIKDDELLQALIKHRGNVEDAIASLFA